MTPKREIVKRYIENETSCFPEKYKYQAALNILEFTVEMLMADDNADRDAMISVITNKAK